jgi:hypothetical protein
MRVRQGQPKLFFQPGQFLGFCQWSCGSVGERQVLALPIAGVDGCAGRQRGQAGGDRAGLSKDSLNRYCPDVSSSAVLNDLRIEQVRGRKSTRLGKTPSILIARWLNPLPIDLQQGCMVLGQRVADEQWNPLIGDVRYALQQQVSIRLVRFSTIKASTILNLA